MKRIKSVGKSDKETKRLEAEVLYLDKAAKLVPYKVDIYERVIYIPEPMLAEGMQDLGVAHLCKSYDFHVQSVIPTSTENYTKDVYDPKMSNRVRVVEEAKISPYKVNDLYKVVSTGGLMKIVRTEKGKLELAYLSYDERIGHRANLLISNEQMTTQLRKEILIEYHQ